MGYKYILSLILVMFSAQCSFCADMWVNTLRKTFINNSAIIYEINLRTFAAQDNDKDGIIDFSKGEESGNFINAIGRLDELSNKGINVIHVMPITPVGKTKALGTAGSLYAASDFSSINPQLVSKKSNLSAKMQAIQFINEAHKRGIAVIIDLPSCGSYDLFLKRPELFLKDKMGQPVIPADWTDVRLLNAGNETSIKTDVYNVYKEFVDMVINLGADGIRADVATCKPAKFWKDLISYSRRKDPQFLWLAEASESWKEPISSYAVFTPYDKLLEAGFDGYYGSFFNLKDVKTGKELINLIQNTVNNLNKYTEPKAVIGSFTTHDEMSPILINGENFSEMIIWLNATLPINSYFVDGFDTGDNYLYMWGNKEAQKSYTDDDNYFVHRGKIDIFNFSRKPGGNNKDILGNFVFANGVKRELYKIINNGKFVPLKTSDSNIFAYAIGFDGKSVIVFGNINYKSNILAKVFVPKLTENNETIPIKLNEIPLIKKRSIEIELEPGEIQVLFVDDLEIK